MELRVEKKRSMGNDEIIYLIFLLIILYHINMIIISPSKNLNLNDEVLKINHSLPLFLSESIQLTQKLKL